MCVCVCTFEKQRVRDTALCMCLCKRNTEFYVLCRSLHLSTCKMHSFANGAHINTVTEKSKKQARRESARKFVAARSFLFLCLLFLRLRFSLSHTLIFIVIVVAGMCFSVTVFLHNKNFERVSVCEREKKRTTEWQKK